MTDDTVLLIGIGKKKTRLGQIIEYTKAIDVENDHGADSLFMQSWELLFDQFGAQKIYILNLDSWDDLKEQDDLFQQEDFSYIVPLDLYLSDSYQDILTQKTYFYSQLLVWLTHRSHSTVIFTGQHASGFTTLTEYLEHEKQEIEEVQPSFRNLRKQNIIYVANCLNAYSHANVILTGMLLGDIGEYPGTENLYAACFDIDWCDVSFDMVFWKNNYLTDTSVENLMNFSDAASYIKPVTVDRICKYIARHWPDLDQFIGTAFTEYKMTCIHDIVDQYLTSLHEWILYDHKIDGISSVQNPDSTVGIHISYTLWPHFTTEKITDEVIL